MGVLSFKFILLVVCAFAATSVLFDLRTPRFSHSYLTTEADTKLEAQHRIRNAQIGKVTMLYGESNPLYERAIQGQESHNEKFGYPMFVLREKMLPGYWSKPAYILQLILTELAKPEQDRLHWLFWVDGDIVLMNPNVPLEIFLPPEPAYADVHCVTTNDHRGLNNGAFFIRVNDWAVWLFSAIVSLTTFQPDVELKFGDQTAMQIILEQERFANSTIYVPQRWFNAYAGYRGKGNHDPFSKPKKWTANAVLEGDLQVHLAGGKKHRTEYMTPYLDASELHTDRWELPFEKTSYQDEIRNFWQKEASKQRKAHTRAPNPKGKEPTKGADSIEGFVEDMAHG